MRVDFGLHRGSRKEHTRRSVTDEQQRCSPKSAATLRAGVLLPCGFVARSSRSCGYASHSTPCHKAKPLPARPRPILKTRPSITRREEQSYPVPGPVQTNSRSLPYLQVPEERLNRVHPLASADPTGRTLFHTLPGDKSPGYFRMSLWDKPAISVNTP